MLSLALMFNPLIADEYAFGYSPVHDIYSENDLASATLRACYNSVPGDKSIHAAMVDLGWNEIRRTDLPERHITALAARELSHALTSIPHDEVYAEIRTWPKGDSVWQAAWDLAIHEATKTLGRPVIRIVNPPIQSFYFEIDGSNALLSVGIENYTTSSSTGCYLVTTADIGHETIALRFREMLASINGAEIMAPLYFANPNMSETEVLSTAVFDNEAIAQLIGDEFPFIGHLGVTIRTGNKEASQ